MPKMKTHRGAAKRLRVTASGKVKRFRAYKSHLLASKTPKQKRRLRHPALVDTTDRRRVARLLPYEA
ncbi:50S ribosomal protein L35 [Neomoorella thermoacetica]|uniref:Large ribosomal subunit protein bL35 n=1 Tax=Neomoorella thermoacetica TaxID=1525 RepID=A0A1D7XC49_NEOTH|nr:50S ribosomal protein L35 [Moorella thermoacetica]AOQ24504.1 50S ribosomal protein L35 [Moorella thermoacetica]APC08955.1 50S ribosomal protein L35 [Moorella thermoacetica]OIQ09515.1 50S ribosomal protein L35 [Moorella thermoacetica]OIQ11860.1 50S ribosomal protein L35 [Moorella thermoacetica]OIQ62898.1 50S ribosomal protein L35 [Moorella thermoacetica]